MAFITLMNRNCIDALWSKYEKSVMLPPQLGGVRALLQRAATHARQRRNVISTETPAERESRADQPMLLRAVATGRDPTEGYIFQDRSVVLAVNSVGLM